MTIIAGNVALVETTAGRMSIEAVVAGPELSVAVAPPLDGSADATLDKVVSTVVASSAGKSCASA